MDFQPTIQALNAEIQKLTSARDTLAALDGTQPKATAKRRAPTISAEGRKRLADNMRKRWAEKKRLARAAKKGTK
jgi:hypothetical protein